MRKPSDTKPAVPKPAITASTPVFQLAWPIFIETLLFMLMGNVDTLMLSQYSDLAVAAVGNANQMIGSLMILFNVSTAAVGVMVAQYLGARQHDILNRVYSLGVWVNVLAGALLATGFFLFKAQVYQWMNLPLELVADTDAYAVVLLGAMPFSAAYIVLSTIHKNHGLTKLTMQIAIGINILNIIGNYIFLFGPFGLPVLGVQGVALSTVISRGIGLLVMLYTLKSRIHGRLSMSLLWPLPKPLIQQFFRIGLPSAGEPISFQFSQVVIFSMINTLGTVAITARMYTNMLVMFTYLFALAIAQATQIITGHLVGAGDYDAAQSMVWRSVKKAWAVTLGMSCVLILLRVPLLHIFTDDPSIIALAASVMLVDLFLEWGRATNITLIFSMRAAGDVHFPVLVGIASMWGIATLGAYVLGLPLGLGLVGIWIAMAADEITRGFIMIWRWRAGGWRGKRIVQEQTQG